MGHTNNPAKTEKDDKVLLQAWGKQASGLIADHTRAARILEDKRGALHESIGNSRDAIDKKFQPQAVALQEKYHRGHVSKHRYEDLEASLQEKWDTAREKGERPYWNQIEALEKSREASRDALVKQLEILATPGRKAALERSIGKLIPELEKLHYGYLGKKEVNFRHDIYSGEVSKEAQELWKSNTNGKLTLPSVVASLNENQRINQTVQFYKALGGGYSSEIWFKTLPSAAILADKNFDGIIDVQEARSNLPAPGVYEQLPTPKKSGNTIIVRTGKDAANARGDGIPYEGDYLIEGIVNAVDALEDATHVSWLEDNQHHVGFEKTKDLRAEKLVVKIEDPAALEYKSLEKNGTNLVVEFNDKKIVMKPEDAGNLKTAFEAAVTAVEKMKTKVSGSQKALTEEEIYSGITKAMFESLSR